MVEHDRDPVAFPTLDSSQLADLSRCTGATLERYKDGETLFRAGDKDFKFVVKSGQIEIVDDSGETAR